MDVIAQIVLDLLAWRFDPSRSQPVPPSPLPRLATRWGTPAFDPDGFLVLRYNSWTRGIVLIVVFGVASGLTTLVLLNPPEPAGAVGVAAFYGIILALLWDCLRLRLVVSPEGLDCRSPWRGRHFVPWEDVEQVSYNVRDQSFTIWALDGYQFRVPTWGMALSGIDVFLEECERHLPLEAMWPARDGYTALGRESPARADIHSN